MDLEGFAKRGLLRKDPEIKKKLISLIQEIKRISKDKALILAEAVIEEAEATLHPRGEVFRLENVGVSMGDYGVGSRGSAIFIHTPRSPRSSAAQMPSWTHASWTTRA